jgi:nucleoside 2-deoxyribosyltransferase
VSKVQVLALKKIYIAAPLFSSAERTFNRELKHSLKAFFSVYLPQEDGELLSDLVERGKDLHISGERIFHADLAAIRQAEILLVVLDGRVPDEGACFELGYGYALGKSCVGLQTDPRRLLHAGNNPMIQHALRRVFQTVDELVGWAKSAR